MGQFPGQTVVVTPNVERMLRQVVLDVFDDRVEVVWDRQPGAPYVHRARLSAEHAAGRRAVGLSAASEWVDITILDLDVSATLFEYDDESYMEAILRELALVAAAYLRGEGLVEQKRGILRTRPILKIIVNGNEWILGRRMSSIHYPEGASTGGSPT